MKKSPSLFSLPCRLIFFAFFVFILFNQQLWAAEWRLAIAQSVKHSALDEVVSGVKHHFLEDDSIAQYIIVITDNESESAGANSESIRKITAFDPHLIITIGTQASQLLSRHIPLIPVVFSAVTDPVGAGLVEDPQKPGGLITGLTDMSPVEAHLDIIIRIQPEIRNLGMVFSQFEQNAVMIKEHLNKVTENYGVKLVAVPVRRGEQVTDKALEILNHIDALYISTDNHVVSGISDLVKLCAFAQIPLYAADPSSVASGAVVALSIDYFQMGLQTGAMSRRILEGADPGLIPVERPKEMSIAINVNAAERMNVFLPMDIILAADLIFDHFPSEYP